MPTYDYRCRKCGKIFEEYRPMSDPEADCPVCGVSAERLISPGAGLLFKGSGFYITDYRSSEYKNKAAAESKSPVTKKETKRPPDKRLARRRERLLFLAI